MQRTDYLIIGGGIIGINIALELKKRFPKESIIVLEKENSLGQHASGRNSGVIHAGFYYTSNSLKAKFTRQGNLALTKYCKFHKLPINSCGKLVVAFDSKELKVLDKLYERGKKNDVPLEMLSESDAKKIEPRIKTYKRALFSPSTATADPMMILDSMLKNAIKSGIIVDKQTQYLKSKNNIVYTNKDSYSAGYIVNASGLYADHVALNYGFSEKYRILPFKGLYLYGNEPIGAFKTNIYPVPNLANPFLGVHITIPVSGIAKIGPTAIPAFWREQYSGFDNFNIQEAINILYREAGLMFYSDFEFRKLAFSEIKKYNKRHLSKLASQLATGITPEKYNKWGKTGIRAQLINIKTRRLEMDFVLEGDENSFHVLNAVSPGWTCAIPFSNHICNQIEIKRSEA